MHKTEKDLTDEALKVYKIPPEYLFHSRYDEEAGEIVGLTCGGKRFRHRKGEKAKIELTHTEITGNPPEKENDKLNQKINLKTLLSKIGLKK